MLNQYEIRGKLQDYLFTVTFEDVNTNEFVKTYTLRLINDQNVAFAVGVTMIINEWCCQRNTIIKKVSMEKAD